MIIADKEFSVGVGGWGPTGAEQGVMTAQLFKLVSGILSQNDVSRIREYEYFVSYGNGIAQVAGNIVFPMRFPGFEIYRLQVSWLSVAPIVSDYAIADPQTRLDFEASFAITVDDFRFWLGDIYDRVALAVAGAQIEFPVQVMRVGSINSVASSPGKPEHRFARVLQIVGSQSLLVENGCIVSAITLIDYRGGVARFFFAGGPNFLPGQFIESDERSLFRAWIDKQEFSVNDG